ncbi:hypothetical protein NBRC10512_007256 [Rhodotorula toruloides]
MNDPLYTEVEQVLGPGSTWITAPSPSTSSLASSSNSPASDSPVLFHAFRRTYKGAAKHDSYIWLQIVNPGLLKALKAVFPTLATLYKSVPGIDARAVYVQREALRSDASSPALDSLLCYVEASFAYVAETITTYPAGTISWHLLWTQLEIGEDLETVHDVTGETMAITLDSWAYVQEAMGRALNLSCHFYQWAGTCWHRIPVNPQDLRIQQILALPARPLTKEKKASLRERGQTYTQYAGQVHASYEGFFFTGAFSGADRLMGEGQVVIDVKSFRRCNPTLDHWGCISFEAPPLAAELTSTAPETTSLTAAGRPKEQLHLLLPSIHGFSLRAKRFGKFLISRLSPVIWRDESFSHLVIPASYRQIVKALVTVHAGELKEKLMVNAVEGKGNGLVMAFHGAPGTGKTLTAEAVAEHLRRPLYVVSAGELGMTAQTLDNQLKNVLELATAWNAVILIDEADIFLTKRDTRQLERNALVGIFLRLLKYSGGVLILTTNHIKNFGKAFLSRFAIVLRFDELDEPSCRTLWEQFLLKATSSSSSSLSAFDLAHLASFRLNGRDIKHVIQTAQAVALVKGDELGMEHLDDVLRVAKSGMRRE